MKITKLNDSALIIDDFLSEHACQELVAKAERHGFEDALIISGGQPILAKEIRNNQRVIMDDFALTAEFWSRMKEHLAITIEHWRPVRLNERLRFYRYEPKQSFRLHRDFPYESGKHKSFLSLIIYLNEDFTGGETKFREFNVKPKTGRAIIFEHDMLHEGCTVKSGIKYAVRTDVMFQKTADQKT